MDQAEPTKRLYFRQLLAGQDVAQTDAAAGQMANFMYLIGDTESRECVVVDPAWDIEGLLDTANQDDMKITGALVTHYHPDHVGGEIFGLQIQGLAQLLSVSDTKVYVNKNEADGLKQVTGVSDSDLVKVDGGDTVSIGDIEIRFVHTPGHTPGSQCFLVDNRLIAGDTLFIGGCGRVDLPGGISAQLYESLTQKLAKLPDDTILFPGHKYSDRTQNTLGDEKQTNTYLRIPTLDDWLRLMGS